MKEKKRSEGVSFIAAVRLKLSGTPRQSAALNTHTHSFTSLGLLTLLKLPYSGFSCMARPSLGANANNVCTPSTARPCFHPEIDTTGTHD